MNVLHQPEAHRFVIHLDGYVARVDYALRPGAIVLKHT